ncbi:MAG: hypothetical protein LBK42_05580 [Propionibacteriaceae bacterium]|jgi:outer membrane receptor protein involved in Fe transport|nr:hypothetical protein [Propionibacteriaceae bacterium]
MSRTTIAIQTDTRARIKAGAKQEAKTIDSFLRDLLDARERDRFWDSFQDVTPQSYAAALAEDGDSLNDDYSLEGRGLEDAER